MRSLTPAEVVVEMLRSYNDVCGGGDHGSPGDAADSRLLMRHPLWRKGSFPELYRCLYEQRSREPRLYWHVAERYLRTRRKQVRDHCPVCCRPTDSVHTHYVGGLRQRFKPTDVIVEVWHPRVDMARVGEGVDWIVAEHRGCPMLPPELYGWETAA